MTSESHSRVSDISITNRFQVMLRLSVRGAPLGAAGLPLSFHCGKGASPNPHQFMHTQPQLVKGCGKPTLYV